MPHISVKMIKGRTEKQKEDLCRALEKTICDTLGCSSTHVTVSIEDFDGKEWQEVFKKDVSENKHLYKKPQYDPKTLL